MDNLTLDQILNDDNLRRIHNLESKDEFFIRVYKDFSRLSLNCSPYDITSDIIDCTWSIVRGESAGSYDRATELYNWFVGNIKKDFGVMGEGLAHYKVKSASETFVNRKGACIDFGFLYTAMARVAGIESYFVHVDEDYKGRTDAHACSGIYVKNSLGLILVDPANGGFDVKHKRFRVLSDDQVKVYYNEYCLAWNSGNVEKFLSVADRMGIAMDERVNQEVYRSIPNFYNFRNFALASAFVFAVLVVGSALDSFNGKFSTANHRVRHVTEETVRSDRKERFERMVDDLKKNYSNDDRLNYVWYPNDYLLVSRMYIDNMRRNLSK